ncbi:UvrD-helicase domain-containing protein [Nocardiopsis synnemataformans]|uniref:UvrD-helicase domain-containing protein n=1 Tax=Nocardiopsis synnemataformans TaxID=61305 RepID=UPI003EB746FB
MPILLDDIASIAKVASPKVGPKYFSKALTGSGNSAGVINDRVRPGRYRTGQDASSMARPGMDSKSRRHADGVTTHTVPLAIMPAQTLADNLSPTSPIVHPQLTMPVPDRGALFHVNSGQLHVPMEFYLGLTPQSLILTEDETTDRTVRTLDILYRMEVYVLLPGSTTERVALRARPRGVGEECVMVDWSYAPLDDAEGLLTHASGSVAGGSSVNPPQVDFDALTKWMNSYDVHERICDLAQAWSTMEVADVVSHHIEETFADPQETREEVVAPMATLLHRMEFYKVSLEAYRKIHAVIDRVCTSDVATQLVKQNLNLLMSHTLENLNTLKPGLPSPPNPPNHGVQLSRTLSSQQTRAVHTNEPLALVLAGAGTGKSTVILARIEYLTRCGVNPTEVTVLSFTNAAADNIHARNPDVGSMTIARMIHDIYSLNHPDHELSTIDTIVNCLDIFYPNSAVARKFRRLLRLVSRNDPTATTDLNNFIEQHYEQVIEMLDYIGQTCLELQIIICYQRIDQMAEPPHVLSRYLIIDEVQDNSVFEFIYVLKYVAKHRENLFIVGDAAQTLYEFRASNPRALNTLEGSGVFVTYQLTTNYRSNQEVLDFANVLLADIEANSLSRIRLQANSLVAPSAASFQDAVTLNYQYGERLSDFDTHYPAYLRNLVKPWVQERLDRGEQVAFLMRSRKHVTMTEHELRLIWPNQRIANLVSDRAYSTTVFSQFVKDFWDQVSQVPNHHQAAHAIAQGIDENLDKIVPPRKLSKSRDMIIQMVSDWMLQNNDQINEWVSLVDAKRKTRGEFFEDLKRSALEFEIEYNAMRQRLTNHRNRQRKEHNLQSNPELVVSTIHGAKGLEFDHTVVLHQCERVMSEENKRMYYVGFTRAQESEFVLGYGTVRKPRIEHDYDAILAALDRRDNINLLQARGVDVDSLPDEELDKVLQSMPRSLRRYHEQATITD